MEHSDPRPSLPPVDGELRVAEDGSEVDEEVIEPVGGEDAIVVSLVRGESAEDLLTRDERSGERVLMARR